MYLSIALLMRAPRGPRRWLTEAVGQLPFAGGDGSLVCTCGGEVREISPLLLGGYLRFTPLHFSLHDSGLAVLNWRLVAKICAFYATTGSYVISDPNITPSCQPLATYKGGFQAPSG
jgi:hypothetical protein